MMKLSKMQELLKTVDGEWRSPIAEAILKNWDYDEGSVFFLRASANFIFVFKRNQKRYFLRFNHEEERGKQSIEAEMNILEHLENFSSFNVAKPIKSLHGNFIEVVDTEIGRYNAVVFEGLKGKHYEMEEITTEQAYLWGQTLGKLHECFKKLPENLTINRPSWRTSLVKASEILAIHEKTAYEELIRISKWAEGLNISKENFGMIHYDFELDNVLFDNRMLGILDFDDCMSNWYLADIVYALRDAGEFTMQSLIINKFIEGYESETKLDSSLLVHAQEFMRIHELVTFAALIRSVDIEESTDHPEWLINLRRKLSERIDRYRKHSKRN
ncbi:Ser/Thr protein kinase RdoA (MazF antagonist) [Bacillus mesophilus]|uniref:Phosphotransferase n=1 Tax=Bacillus mesophilus TaxID=1808955 RepID=A0A6M0Q7Y9_9BACI|nr:phosphotransferase [Bacillus mesophilus]MBM7662178.1 Ser/Thr protein kinase RdoA (MazF antagonist) [Bacillus mesophilus]NEY72471.1 phosphotransferase [Bacillus mesophilus]